MEERKLGKSGLKVSALRLGCTILTSIFVLVLGTLTLSEAKTMKDKGLDTRQEKIVTIAAFTAKGDLSNLKTALKEGLDASLTVSEIKEILVQMYAYAGFPRSLNAIDAFMGVIKEREQNGIKDEPGKEPSALPADKSSIDLGTEIQTRLAGRPVTGAIYTFAPAIDRFLKSHLFGDIFGRDNLDFRSREIATISALSSMDGVNSQLEAHIRIGFNTGLTEAQTRSLVSVLEARVGKREAGNADSALNRVLGRPDAKGGNAMNDLSQGMIFPKGERIPPQFSKYFIGTAYLSMLVPRDKEFNCPIGNVTFEPGARNNWHKHPGGQILLVIGGRGYYQESGRPARELRPGDVVKIAPDVKHWHGAAPDSSLVHLSIETNVQAGPPEWLEPVTDEEYAKLK
jgi:quercetin dioxygenase-like cupin family protein/alkylhydroperoxidase/carboxymuconolactone decarboxylase family protein YurZ